MRIPVIGGIIDRRILANFCIEPEVMAAQLPAPFEPLVVHGYAVGGICLIRLKQVRPTWFPIPWGLHSENAAHRIAVTWEDAGQTCEGVYIPRRDTNSRLASWAGGSLFPGLHHLASFDVQEAAGHYSVALASNDGATHLRVSGEVSETLPEGSIFPTVAAASDFFERGSLGYSDTGTPGRYDGLELRCQNWRVTPLKVDTISSSYFEDPEAFPSGSVRFDCALLMQDINHEWHGRDDLCCAEASSP